MRIEIINVKYLKLLMAIIGLLIFSNSPAAPKEFDLHQAVLDDNLRWVEKLLSEGAAVDVIGSRKYGYGSALHLAVREGHLNIAKLLLDRGAQVDVLDPDDFTPLHNAAWNGNLDMAKLLLDAGADIEASTYDGDTPLSLAQNNDQPKVAEFIQAKLQSSATSETKFKPPSASDPGAIDISGTYVSDMTSNHHTIFGTKKKRSIELTLYQRGNKITGTASLQKGELEGVLDEDTIDYVYWAFTHGSWGGKIIGTWKLNADGTKMNGSWRSFHWPASGKWNLTRIE